MIDPQHWQPADGLKLEPNALEAAREQVASLALTAGPGAGKTEMLAQRADFLLRTGQCPYPRRILAISFKVDAAKNLKERVRKRCGPDLAGRLDSHTFHAFAKRLIDRFRPLLTGNDALDPDYTIGTQRITHKQIEFADLVPFALQILAKSAAARNAIRQTYSHVFLDEFQDCTGQQYQLIKAAFLGTGALLTAVGDTKQKIMGFAGAMEGVFKYFLADFGAKPLNLYQNFRSDPRLRRMQNEMVKVMDPDAAIPDEQLEGDVGKIGVLRFDDADQEAAEIAGMIHGWLENGAYLPSDMAVLVARQADLYAQKLTQRLQAMGVPFRSEQALQDLASEPIARVVVDYLSVVFGDREPDAYGRLVDFLLQDSADEEEASHLLTRWHARIQVDRDSLQQLGAEVGVAKQIAVAFAKEVGRTRLATLSPDYEKGPRLEESFYQTLQRIEELAPGNGVLGALQRFADDSAVRIMTMHKSKGLEFDVVFVLGVEKQMFWANPDEERAVFFVAISRARHQLFLTAADHRPRPDGHKGKWTEQRDEHDEFIGYATAVLE
jgi:superfamily I DNA/RNA helicase